MRQEIKDNVGFVSDLMTTNKHGALMQLFILTAIDRYAAMVVDMDNKGELGDAFGQYGLIDKTSWVSCAKEVSEQFDRRLGADKGSVNSGETQNG